jgi:hypothetical protein
MFQLIYSHFQAIHEHSRTIVLCTLYRSIYCLYFILSVKTSIEPYTKLKILMIKMWIVLKLIPSHDLSKLWLKLK